MTQPSPERKVSLHRLIMRQLRAATSPMTSRQMESLLGTIHQTMSAVREMME
jgi:hypothetical protein